MTSATCSGLLDMSDDTVGVHNVHFSIIDSGHDRQSTYEEIHRNSYCIVSSAKPSRDTCTRAITRGFKVSAHNLDTSICLAIMVKVTEQCKNVYTAYHKQFESIINSLNLSYFENTEKFIMLICQAIEIANREPLWCIARPSNVALNE